MTAVYDGLIREALALFSGEALRKFSYASEDCAPEGEKNPLILKREAAFELGGSGLPSTGLLAITQDETLVSGDCCLLLGKDLPELRADAPFARLTFLLADAAGGEQETYSLVQELDLIKYGLSPRGCMLRASAFSSREQLRVSKGAVRAGLSFQKLGNLMIRKYKEHPRVRAVTILFVTLPEGPFGELETLSSRCAALTKTLNHMFENTDLDCQSCQWKPVCDEVEGMKGLHRQIARH